MLHSDYFLLRVYVDVNVKEILSADNLPRNRNIAEVVEPRRPIDPDRSRLFCRPCEPVVYFPRLQEKSTVGLAPWSCLVR